MNQEIKTQRELQLRLDAAVVIVSLRDNGPMPWAVPKNSILPSLENTTKLSKARFKLIWKALTKTIAIEQGGKAEYTRATGKYGFWSKNTPDQKATVHDGAVETINEIFTRLLTVNTAYLQTQIPDGDQIPGYLGNGLVRASYNMLIEALTMMSHTTGRTVEHEDV